MDFIAIDFEIANNKLDSACSLGMVFVQENKIIAEKYFVIQPPSLFMEREFTKIHGLTQQDLKDAPKFDEVWNEISHHFTEENYIIAHNAQFDMSVLKNCLLTYSFELPTFPYICSIPISTRACRGEGIGSSLKARTEHFGITLNDHHHALSDARACAELVIKSIQIKSRKSIGTYLSTFSSIPIKNFKDLKAQTSFKQRKKKFNKIKVSDIIPKTKDFDPTHPLYSKNIVFTGELSTLDRKDAMQKVVDLGGHIKSGVSGVTDYLVIGTQDENVVGKSGISSKQKKACELIEKGKNLKILSEDEFKLLLTEKVNKLSGHGL
ncbi:exonuclease [Virgibacillus soli]|uniref:exonuclease domain-containing protein n=1 Tax=Lederbergia galactosidilytica TaxID=217031 RepID=UPI000714E9F1|nr:exonuclease domain-containing protein [Lederbergia galactosidilytica]KRG14458.1 exonuclease [Virgibacillus soli]MBP1914992.1 DNA polymerase-3 subunit epsilon [Lederbergia galactosidilytica]